MKSSIEKIIQHVQKPGRYIGGELNSVIKDKNTVDIRYAFCFPDLYEIGMSHLGMKILYSLVNSFGWAWCERVFAPDNDMEELMRANGVPLYALESGDSISEFDIIGFTLMFELSYTNMLNMLDLAGLGIFARERECLTPIVCCGGPCACNPEPIADFVDIVFLGDGEESTTAVLKLLRECKAKGCTKGEFLLKAKDIQGVYVPSLYKDEYYENGMLKSLTPLKSAPATVKKSAIYDLDNCFYPDKFVVPFISIVHDRAVEEIFRGCIRGCRFCQAGFTYRPIREKSVETINKQARLLIESTGYDELSLCSLSTSDHSKAEQMLSTLADWTAKDKINLSLPSLRIDNFSPQLAEKLSLIKKSGLTFAPEAGTQRLRDVINKNITEQEVLASCKTAFDKGWSSVKLYFMMGLPTETMADIEGISDLAQKIVDLYYANETRKKGVPPLVSVSCSSFIPKPFTPFQWCAQDSEENLAEKQHRLLEYTKSRKIKIAYHETYVSLLEGVLARGDRRLSAVIYDAWKMGCKFDSWSDKLKFELWLKAFEINGIDPYFYTSRERKFDELLPWDHLDFGVSRRFLESEYLKAQKGKTTPSCRIKCAGCGADKLCKGQCDGRIKA
ncbi:MAG: TIGR03960 family B12-binding radical SAM protein [Clostridiales bacterium]|nr:TIGR03960 family B12-binding radical SAM protein [Clostridiales bacterium]